MQNAEIVVNFLKIQKTLIKTIFRIIQLKQSDFNEGDYKELMNTLNRLVEEEVYEANF